MKTLLFIFVILGFSFKPEHKFYVSHFQLNHSVQEKNLQLTIKIFTDDLQRALQIAGHGNIRLNGSKDEKSADLAIADYIRSKLKISADGRNYLQWLGKEYEADVVWVYMEIREVADPPALSVSCSLLTDLFEDQINIFDLRAGNFHHTKMLTKKEDSFKISMK